MEYRLRGYDVRIFGILKIFPGRKEKEISSTIPSSISFPKIYIPDRVEFRGGTGQDYCLHSTHFLYVISNLLFTF